VLRLILNNFDRCVKRVWSKRGPENFRGEVAKFSVWS
jgi:hypothetical protein